MAARVLLRQRAAPLAAFAVLAGIALRPRAAHAEAPAERQSKKPIYDDVELTPTEALLTPSPPDAAATAAALSPPATSSASAPSSLATKARSPTPTDRLAVQVGKARLFLHRYAVKAEDGVNSAMDKAFDLEHSFTSTIASLAPARETGEKLMPGALYVLVAAMAGSIVSRNRGIVLRAATPFALGIAAGWVVLPVTMRNVSDLAWRYEQRFPAVAEGHVKIRDGLARGWSFAKVHTEVGARYVDEKVTDARESVEGWVRKGK